MKTINQVLPIVVALCFVVVAPSCAQKNEQPFYEEIQAFKKADKESPPPQNAILFTGSSSFRLWQDIDKYFPGYEIINRGFGGSGLNDLILYKQDIITPYNPKQVVIYSGENDIAMGASASDVMVRFKELFNMIRKDLPDASIVYLSIKPSPSRVKFQSEMEKANTMIRQFLSDYPDVVYIDVYHLMLDKDGKPRKELFSKDDLHMNEKGYEIWRDAVTPHLLK